MRSNPQHTHPSEIDFQEYLDGEMTPEAADSFTAHIADCQECAAALAGWQRTYEWIAGQPDVSLEKDLSQMVLKRIEDAPETGRLLNLILAEAALGTTLALTFWPRLQAWLSAGLANAGSLVQSGLTGLQLSLNRLVEPILAFRHEDISLGLDAVLKVPWLLPAAAALALLLALGNGIILRSTQFDTQRR